MANSTWLLILNNDLWFCFLISILSGAAQAGAQFRDLTSRGNFPLNTEDASLELHNDFPVPATQTEMVKRLLKQLYTQMDERNDVVALEEHTNQIQDKALKDFEWLVCTHIGVKCLFLSKNFPEGELQEIMEQIILENPRVEITHRMRQLWVCQVEENSAAKIARVQSEAYHKALADATQCGINQVRQTASFEADDSFQHSPEQWTCKHAEKYDKDITEMEDNFKMWFNNHKQERKLYYDKLDREEQLKVICKEVLALGIITHDELQERAVKKQ